MNAILFDTKNKSALLSYTDLAKTMRIGDSTGNMPKQIPMQPGELILHVKDLIKKQSGLDIIENPVVIREPYIQTNLNKMKAGLPLEIEDYLVRRFVTKFDVDLSYGDGTPDKMNASFALTYCYTDGIKGMQIAFGERVNVCDNLMAFGQYHFSTYGSSKVSFDDGLQLLSHWTQNIRELHEKHCNVVDYLKSYEVPLRDFQRIIGSLFEKAVRFNSGDHSLIAPLNQAQVAAMVGSGIDYLKTKETIPAGEYITAWDVLSWGTNTLKAQNSDMIDLLKCSTAFNDFMHEEFDCPVELAI